MLIRKFALIAVAVLASGLLTSATARADTSATKIMLVGSSTTHGSAGDHTWRYRFWKHLTGAGELVDFVGPDRHLYDNVRSSSGNFVTSTAYADPNFDQDHFARWGKFVGAFSGYPTGAKDEINAQVSIYQPDYVVVMLGLNDLTWFSSRTPAAVAADMQTLVDNARAAKPNVRLVLAAIQPTKWAASNTTNGARVTGYNQLLSALAVASSTPASPVAYVPQAANYQPDPGIEPHDSYDGTHPNARGELRIADAIADVFSATFGLGPAFNLDQTGPVTPFQLTCTPGQNMARLEWTESPGATGYWIQRRVPGGQWDAQVYQLKFLTDNPMTAQYLSPGTTYEYRLQAAKWYDKGVFSNVCSVTPFA